MQEPERILALLPNWLGDAAMCTPALRALHTRFPEARITVSGRSVACELLRGLPWLAESVDLPPQPSLPEMLRIGRNLKPHARDLAVIFPHSFRAALLARMTGARRRIGYARDRRAWLLTDRVMPRIENGAIVPVYMAKEYLDLVAILGCIDDGLGLELHADLATIRAIDQRLAPGIPKVGIAPGGAFGPSKRWPPERFARVADLMAEKGRAQCVLITGPGEEDLRAAVQREAGIPLVEGDGGKPTVRNLKATIAQLNLLICNDSGPRHVAVAFGVPTVCVMGSTSPRYTEGPYERGEVVRVDVDCGPCQKPVCETDHRCMLQITPEMVFAASVRALNPKA
ncbi:MAG TPA: lipopolysaccharide heptosyltransferase II [Candidatus Hydrogenedentes bacterium]|nr:lipopolysaccharide heptosyltransferase II [Candidatus Hydrogenedentota bacterium]HPG69024.1 lipopolysaccharide heptosyltransferase II [Candidatus Hydrogenedentota bacterium]